MIKVMIIDDETLIKLGIESMINWSSLGYTLVPSASNGKEGLEKIIEYKPDLVITDIKMPIMNGLELIEKCSELKLKTKFIVLSSYDDFKTVKQVMRLGVIDYLMKLDLEKETLTPILLEAKTMISNDKTEEKTSKTLYSEHNKEFLKIDFIRKCVIGAVDLTSNIDSFMEELGISKDNRFILVYFKLVNYPQFFENNINENSSSYIFNIISDISEVTKEDLTFIINEKEYVLCIDLNSRTMYNTQQINEHVKQIANKLFSKISQTFNKKIIIGISKPHDFFKDLRVAFLESLESTYYIYTNKKQPIYFFTEQIDKEQKYKVDYILLKKNLTDALEHPNETLLKEVFEHVYECFFHIKIRKDAYELCYKLVYIFTISGSFWENTIKEDIGWDCTLFENIQTLLTLDEIIEWVLQIEASFFTHLNQTSSDMVDTKVKKTKIYIKSNPYTKFSLTKLAKKLDITPGYLSTIFKKVEGKSLSDYIAEVKMEEAKRLLEKQTYKIYEVSSILGYDDPYYFSKVFKKTTSLTPTEYICKYVNVLV